METFNLVEWGVGGIFVGVNAYRRYNTPTSNRETTTFQNYCTYFFFYLATILTLYVFIGALLDSSPETIGAIYGLMTNQPNTAPPPGITDLSAPMVSALFLTTLLPSLPILSRYDKALLNIFWDRGHIPNHVQKMAASMRRAAFSFSPGQIRQLRTLCKSLGIEYASLKLETGLNLDFRWARINTLIMGIEDWKLDDTAGIRRYLVDHKTELRMQRDSLDELNREYFELKTKNLEAHARDKIQQFLDKSMARLFRSCTVFVAKAACKTELSESGRRSRITQLGFEGGSAGFDGLSGRQIATALIAILVTFLTISVVQELSKEPQFRKFGNVAFMTFLMFFTYGSALIIALNLKRQLTMGYNELTRQRSWIAYLVVGIVTPLSWVIVSISYRYILQMLAGLESDQNFERVITDISWSYPYALQSLALAISVSWVLDHHQSRIMTGKLTIQQRSFDILVTVAALGFASMIAYFWMEGLGWFEGYATREETYRTNSPLSVVWLVFKGAAIGAVVGWLVPMWFYLNRSKAPDQIACRLISMNKRGLSEEIRNLEPNELIKAVAAVSASVAAIDNDLSRKEHDVYQIICSHLAGLPNSDIDIDGAEKEFNRCLELIDSNELKLESRLKIFQRLPLLSSLMPYIASSIAFADGVYLEEEHAIVVSVKNHVLA